jgi:hypothetical protein
VKRVTRVSMHEGYKAASTIGKGTTQAYKGGKSEGVHCVLLQGDNLN